MSDFNRPFDIISNGWFKGDDYWMKEFGQVLGKGGSADVYEYGKDKVVKLYFTESPEYIVRWEYEKTKNAYNCGLPTPRVYNFFEIEGRYGFVQDRVNGNSFMTELLDYIRLFKDKEIVGNEIRISERMIWIITETARVLHNIHTINADIMDTMDNTLKRMIENNEYLTIGEKKKLNDLIVELPKENCICHGDPNPGNLISDGINTYLIDWISCIKGHPYYDITEYIQMYDFVELPEKYMEDFIEKNKKDMVNIFIDKYQHLSGMKLDGLDVFYLPQLAAKLGGGCSHTKKLRMLEKVRKLMA